MRLTPLVAATLLAAAPLAGQAAVQPAPQPAAQPAGLRAVQSTRATSVLELTFPRIPNQPAAAALTVTIDYGQPHVRGRDVPVELAKDGTIWRTGANSATTLTTRANLIIAGGDVPAGAYSLYTVREGGKYFLIVNNNTGQSGADYDATKDHVRVPLRVRTTAEVRESLQIALVPALEAPAKGVLSISWGKLELTADWSAK